MASDHADRDDKMIFGGIVQKIRELRYSRVALYGVLGTLAVLYLMPLLVALVTSFKTRIAITQTRPYLPPLPGEVTVENWIQAFELLQQGLISSAILVIPVSLISALLGSMTAYGLTKIDWRGQVAVLLVFIAAVFLPTQAAIVPLSRFWSIYVPLEDVLSPLWQLPLLEPYYGDLLALIITNTAYGLPICTVLFRAYYKGLPDEMFEAARLDGASMFAIYRRIVFPLSGPMFAVTIIYQFTQNWNSFLFPLIIMVSSNHPAAPVTLSLAGLGAGLEGVDYGLRMSGALLTALPTLIVFLLFGERFAKGVAGNT
jgi:glucose/mannose transport system permease protein